MCDPYNELDCPITISTIGTPDATFVAQKVGEDLQFRGIQLSGGVIGVLSPTSMLLDTITPPNPVPADGAIGIFDQIRYSTLAPALWPTEIQRTLFLSSYNTGIFTGSTLTIPVSSFYKICYNPGIVTQFNLANGASVTHRIRDSANNIYAEFYSRSIGNDEYTNNFCHVVFMPAGTYTFSIQVTGLSPSEYQDFLVLRSSFSVKRVSV